LAADIVKAYQAEAFLIAIFSPPPLIPAATDDEIDFRAKLHGRYPVAPDFGEGLQ